MVKSGRHQVIHRNSKTLIYAHSAMWRTVCGWNYYGSAYEFVEGELTKVTCNKCLATAPTRRNVSRSAETYDHLGVAAARSFSAANSAAQKPRITQLRQSNTTSKGCAAHSCGDGMDGFNLPTMHRMCRETKTESFCAGQNAGDVGAILAQETHTPARWIFFHTHPPLFGWGMWVGRQRPMTTWVLQLPEVFRLQIRLHKSQG